MATVFSDSNLRAVVSLLGEVAALEAPISHKKRFFVDGLSTLISADLWMWNLAPELDPAKMPVFTSAMSGGFVGDQFSRFLVALEHPDMARLTAPLAEELKTEGRHLTRLPSEFDPENDLMRSEAFHYWEKAQVGPALLSFRPIGNGCASGVAFYRHPDRKPFNKAEADLAHLALSEIPWLHEEGWPGAASSEVAKLSRQQRLTLNLVLEGLGRKEIATQMSLSPHTIGDYLKALYKHFQVSTQVELITKFQEPVSR